MIQFIVSLFVISIISMILMFIAAALFHLAKSILVGILAIFYRDKARSIADAIATALLWVLGICGALLLTWGMVSLFGIGGTAAILVVVFAVLFYLGSG